MRYAVWSFGVWIRKPEIFLANKNDFVNVSVRSEFGFQNNLNDSLKNWSFKLVSLDNSTNSSSVFNGKWLALLISFEHGL